MMSEALLPPDQPAMVAPAWAPILFLRLARSSSQKTSNFSQQNIKGDHAPLAPGPKTPAIYPLVDNSPINKTFQPCIIFKTCAPWRNKRIKKCSKDRAHLHGGSFSKNLHGSNLIWTMHGSNRALNYARQVRVWLEEGCGVLREDWGPMEQV